MFSQKSTVDHTNHTDHSDTVHSQDNLRIKCQQQNREFKMAYSLNRVHPKYDVPEFLKHPADCKIPLLSMVGPP